MLRSIVVVGILAVLMPHGGSRADSVTVAGTIAVTTRGSRAAARDGAVVWLEPLSGGAAPAAAASVSRPRIVQQDKKFEPHLLVVPVGSAVEFPNRDPFFHNVFSMFDGKRFDLGLYEAGSSRSVTFSRAGVSFIFCNIHPEMSGVIVAVPTPYYGVSDRSGQIAIPEVPVGRYRVGVWHERHQLERAGDFPREITIGGANPSIGTVRLVETDQVITAHKNKYGHDYVPPPPTSPLYKKQP